MYSDTERIKDKLENTTVATKMASEIVQPRSLYDPDTELGVNVAPRWHFQMYLVATGITDKTNKAREIV